MKLVGNTDIGKLRTENQDRFCMGGFSQGEGFALVCDGMGGASGGAVASKLAIDCMQSLLQSANEACEAGFEKAFLTKAMEEANLKIFQTAAQQENLAGMGTTAVCALVQGMQAFISHAGDSRCYLLRDGVLVQLTRDHSYVQGLVDYGTITLEEAEHHPQRGAITRALGVDHRVEPDFTSITVVPQDVVLLCSDGLSKVLSQTEMEQILAAEPFEELPDLLIAAANQKGGPDNITVVLMGIEPVEANNG
ncbi:MAG: Stp1/IreP family PP2C-type Ser/Thr phosphatase [Faecalibacterium sp.]